MIRRFSLLVAWGSLAILIAAPLMALFFLFNLTAFADLSRSSLPLPIQWQTVTDVQMYGLWLLSVIYGSIGLGGLYFLRRAFIKLSRGELFNQNNSRDLRMFSLFLFAQSLAKPLQLALSSVLLSWHHPAGQRMLSITLGSDEIKVIALAMILWVLSDLLVKASALDNENRQFV